jgi:hypothetical protein
MIELCIAKLFMYPRKHLDPQAHGFSHNIEQLKITCALTDDHHSMHWIPSVLSFNNMVLNEKNEVMIALSIAKIHFPQVLGSSSP